MVSNHLLGKLQAMQIRIRAVGVQQLLVTAGFHYFPMRQYHDTVRTFNC